MLPPPGSPQYSVFGATPLCGQGSRRSPAPQDTPATPRGPLTCGDGTGTQCRPAPALCPGPWAGPCPAAPWDLGRQAGFAVPTGKTNQRGRGLGAFGADWAGEGGTQRAWVGVAGQQAVSSPVPAGCLPGGVLPHGHLPRDTCGAPAAALDARQLALLGLAASLPLLPLCRQHGQQRLLPDARQLRPRLLRG